MLKNLRAEMARECKDAKDIAAILHVTTRTARDKINGKYPFTIPEGFKVRNKIAPHMSLDELFRDEPA